MWRRICVSYRSTCFDLSFFCGVRDQSLVSILYRLSFLNHGVASLFATCDMIVSLVSFASLRRHHSTFYSKVLVDLGNSNLDKKIVGIANCQPLWNNCWKKKSKMLKSIKYNFYQIIRLLRN